MLLDSSRGAPSAVDCTCGSSAICCAPSAVHAAPRPMLDLGGTCVSSATCCLLSHHPLAPPRARRYMRLLPSATCCLTHHPRPLGGTCGSSAICCLTHHPLAPPRRHMRLRWILWRRRRPADADAGLIGSETRQQAWAGSSSRTLRQVPPAAGSGAGSCSARGPIPRSSPGAGPPRGPGQLRRPWRP
jgi:hypothetical protein